MKTQINFLKELQDRASEQKIIYKRIPFPKAFSFIGAIFGTHPWRIFIPFAFIVSLILHLLFKNSFDNIILKIFGGFGLIKLR